MVFLRQTGFLVLWLGFILIAYGFDSNPTAIHDMSRVSGFAVSFAAIGLLLRLESKGSKTPSEKSSGGGERV